MIILAIESSCDETAVALVEDGWKVHSNTVASSLDLHKKTGGVVPEVAARAHIEAIIPTVEEALDAYKPQLSFPEKIKSIKAIAVTTEPGLKISLMVGVLTAQFLADVWQKPLIPIHHTDGHLASIFLERNPKEEAIEYPMVTLSVSGGHNDLYLNHSATSRELLGQSRDDAAGEAFDKIARILQLGYPGGPLIEHGAANNTKPPQFSFSRAWLNKKKQAHWDHNSFDFSFSGLKSEVNRKVKASKLNLNTQNEISFAFQEAVVDVLATKLVYAAKLHQAKSIHLTGGVSANKRLRDVVLKQVEEMKLNCKVRWPKKIQYCTDNAAMIAAAAYQQLQLKS